MAAKLTNYRIAQLIDEALVEAGLPKLKNGAPEIYNRRKTSEGLEPLEALAYVEKFVQKRINGDNGQGEKINLAELRALRAASVTDELDEVLELNDTVGDENS
jgi:hypothetical protein